MNQMNAFLKDKYNMKRFDHVRLNKLLPEITTENINGKRYVLKEFKESMNYGRDYELVDSVKDEFGLIKLNVKRIKSNEQRDMNRVLSMKSLIIFFINYLSSDSIWLQTWSAISRPKAMRSSSS